MQLLQMKYQEEVNSLGAFLICVADAIEMMSLKMI